MKRNKIKLIFVLSIFLLIFFTGINIFTTYVKIKDTVKESIANQSLESAKSIASSLDKEAYERFLLKPEKNEEYWEIRNYLNDAREKIGALYVYTLEVDNPKVSNGMIMGMPEEKDIYPIGTICTVPEKQVKRAFEGKTFVTGEIEDPDYGNYLTVGAPIKDHEGKIIGYLGIDISAVMLNDIGAKVLNNSITVLVFNGAFVFILLISYLLLQRWYQKEVTKEVEDTEDLFLTEFRSLISSVQSFRHDFSNHIQVLHGLLKLGKQDRALDYLNSLIKEVHSIDSINKNIDNPGLSVLLQTKKLSAENHNIDINITTSNHSFNTIKTTDLIKVLANLIDNAMEAVIELPENERKISIDCIVDSNKYIFKITNTGPKINDKENIFKRGYSTKKVKPGTIRGQGLFIVKEVIKKYEGQITMESTEKETTATVIIPINK